MGKHEGGSSDTKTSTGNGGKHGSGKLGKGNDN